MPAAKTSLARVGGVAGVLALTSFALCWLPLTHLLGYEYVFALTLVAAPAAYLLGARQRPVPGRPGRTVVRLYGCVAAVQLPALSIILLAARWVQNCNVCRGLLFFLLLPMASALYAATLGLWAQRWTRGKRRRFWVHLALVGGPLLFALGQLYFQPPIQVFSHFWGYFAGSIYDENIALDGRLLAFRGATLLRILVLATAWARKAPGHVPGRLLRPLRPLHPWLLVALGIAADVLVGDRYGYATHRGTLARVLPQVVCGPGMCLHLPGALPREDAQALLDEHLFRLVQLRGLLGPRSSAQATVWHSYVFANAAQKAYWTGGRGTMVTKPWLGEIYVHGTQLPHPLVAHELAHLELAAFGRWPLALPWQRALMVNMGLVEGAAEALSERDQEYTPTEVAACTDLAGLPARLLGTLAGAAGFSFWQQPGPRAYAEAGAFLRSLLRTYGAGPLRAVYFRGDWQAAYGQPLAQLVANFVAHLQQGGPDSQTCARVRADFQQKSIFQRTCAHEIAALRAAQEGAPYAEGLRLERRIVAHLGPDPAEHTSLAAWLVAANDAAGAQQALRELDAFAQPQAQDLLLWSRQADIRLAALALLAGQLPGARAEAERLAARGLATWPTGPWARQFYARAWALTLPPQQGAPMQQFLSGRAEPWPVAALLGQLAGAGDGTASYLLGRQLLQQGHAEAAAAWLRMPHPFAPVEAERLRCLATASPAQAKAAWTALTDPKFATLAPRQRRLAGDALARLAWQAQQAPRREDVSR